MHLGHHVGIGDQSNPAVQKAGGVLCQQILLQPTAGATKTDGEFRLAIAGHKLTFQPPCGVFLQGDIEGVAGVSCTGIRDGIAFFQQVANIANESIHTHFALLETNVDTAMEEVHQTSIPERKIWLGGAVARTGGHHDAVQIAVDGAGFRANQQVGRGFQFW